MYSWKKLNNGFEYAVGSNRKDLGYNARNRSGCPEEFLRKGGVFSCKFAAYFKYFYTFI